MPYPVINAQISLEYICFHILYACGITHHCLPFSSTAGPSCGRSSLKVVRLVPPASPASAQKPKLCCYWPSASLPPNIPTVTTTRTTPLPPWSAVWDGHHRAPPPSRPLVPDIRDLKCPRVSEDIECVKLGVWCVGRAVVGGIVLVWCLCWGASVEW